MPKEIRGVDTNPKGRDPRQLGRKDVAGSTTETIGPGKYPCGVQREGTPAGTEQRTAKAQRYADGEKHRAGLRDSKY
jgi:hypothetical protein